MSVSKNDICLVHKIFYFGQVDYKFYLLRQMFYWPYASGPVLISSRAVILTYLFREFSKSSGNVGDPGLCYKHALWPTIASEGCVAGQVGLA